MVEKMKGSLVVVGVLCLVVGAASVLAHEITIKGVVAAVEPGRIQVKSGAEKKDQQPAWYPIDAKTKIQRGQKTVTFDQAKIRVGERVVVLVDHQPGGTMKALEVRLAAE